VRNDTGRRVPARTDSPAGGDTSGVLLTGLAMGLIIVAIGLALVDRWAPGVFITNERVEVIIVGMLLGGVAAFLRHHRHRVARGRREHR